MLHDFEVWNLVIGETKMKSGTKKLAGIVFREFRMDDYDWLIKLWDDAKLPYKPKGRDRRAKIKSELKRGNSIFLVAELNGKLIGSLLGTHDGRKGWINRLAVALEFRNKGVARRLVAEAEDRLSKIGIDIVACLIEDWNTNSMQVFEKLGYKKYSGVVYYTKRKNPEV